MKDKNNTMLFNLPKIGIWYYPIIMVGYILTLVSGSIHPGLIASALLVLVLIQSIFDCHRANKASGFSFLRLNTIDLLVLMYFVYNLLSGIWCTAFGMPLSIWAGEFSTGILTMVFYLLGRTLNDADRDKLYMLFIISVYVVCLLGVVLYILAPQFYLDYLYEYSYISKADTATMRIRMISVIGSILVGYLSVVGMLVSSRIVLNNDGKKGKLLLFAGFLFAFLSNQRSAMVVAIIVLVYVNYLVFFVYKLVSKKIFIAELVTIGAGFLCLCAVYFKVILKIYYRLESLPGAIGQRSDQWIGAINNMSNLWLGNGLGASGHRAGELNDYIIADGGIAKLFVENGVVGFSIFVFLMIVTIKYSVKNLRLLACELGIVVIALMQSVGSNILTFQLATPIFWFAIGIVALKGTEEAKE